MITEGRYAAQEETTTHSDAHIPDKQIKNELEAYYSLRERKMLTGRWYTNGHLQSLPCRGSHAPYHA